MLEAGMLEAGIEAGSAGSSAQAELGPCLPSRLTVYTAASEVLACARLAVDLALPGPAMDVPRALRQLERCRAVLGQGQSAPGEEQV